MFLLFSVVLIAFGTPVMCGDVLFSAAGIIVYVYPLTHFCFREISAGAAVVILRTHSCTDMLYFTGLFDQQTDGFLSEYIVDTDI